MSLLLAAAGCATQSARPAPGDHVVLSVHWVPGIGVPTDEYEPPDFVLHGDGRAIVRVDRDTGVVRLVEYRLGPRSVAALFVAAERAGLFDDVDPAPAEPMLDAGALDVLLRTEDHEYSLRIVAPDSGEPGARGAVAGFAEGLRAVPPGADAYRPERVAVVYTVTTPHEIPRPWPLPEAGPVATRCVLLTGPAGERARELGETVPSGTLWHHGGVTFTAYVRPLLPDEHDCLTP